MQVSRVEDGSSPVAGLESRTLGHVVDVYEKLRLSMPVWAKHSFTPSWYSGR